MKQSPALPVDLSYQLYLLSTAEKAYHFYTRFTVASSFQVIQATKYYVAQYFLKLSSTSEKSLVASSRFHTVPSRFGPEVYKRFSYSAHK